VRFALNLWLVTYPFCCLYFSGSVCVARWPCFLAFPAAATHGHPLTIPCIVWGNYFCCRVAIMGSGRVTRADLKWMEVLWNQFLLCSLHPHPPSGGPLSPSARQASWSPVRLTFGEFSVSSRVVADCPNKKEAFPLPSLVPCGELIHADT